MVTSADRSVAWWPNTPPPTAESTVWTPRRGLGRPPYPANPGTSDRVAAQASALLPLLATRHVAWVPVAHPAEGLAKVERHQLDLLLDRSGAPGYWVNLNAPRGYLTERLLLGAYAGPPEGQTPQRRTVTGEALSDADWVLPGVLAMNVMFSSL